MDITQHVLIAINWELKVCINSSDQVRDNPYPFLYPVRLLIHTFQAAYDLACRSKLTDIAQTRTRQAVNLQEQLRNPQPPQVNMMQPQIQMQGMPSSHNPSQFHFTANAHPQLQQPMQASGMPIQQPFMHQQPHLVMGNQQMGMQHMGMQNMPHGPHPQIPPNHAQPHLTVDDNQAIQRIAQNLASSTPRDQLERIRHNLENMQPDQRQFLAQQNLDPITFFFRSHATRKFLEQRARMGQRASHDPNVPGNAVMPQQPGPPSQNSLPIQSQPVHPAQVPPSQMVDPPFGGNMDHILGQQQEALRSQEAGQVVVPASQQRGNLRNAPQQQPNTLLGGGQVMQNVTQSLPAASQYWGNPQILQGNMQPAQAQAPPHTTTLGNMSTPAQLQGQIGGLSSQVGRVAQPAPNMPTLNKGLKESPQTQNRWHQQRGAQPNQPPDQASLGVQQATPQPGAPVAIDANQQRQRLLNQRLASMPQDQRREYIMNFQRRALPAPPANTQATESVTAQLPDNLAGQQMPLQDVSSNATMNNADGAHDPAPTEQALLVAVPSPQQAQSQRAQQVARQNAQVAHLANILSEEQAQQMDQLEFPITILNHTVTLSQLPPNIKTWGQLKSWVSQKNNELPHGVLQKIRMLQGLHYQNLVKQNNQVQQTPQNSAPIVQGTIRPSAPIAPMMVPGRGNGQPFQAGNTSIVTQGPRVTGGPPVPPPTVQEIQAWRAGPPESMLGLSDEQISSSIFKQRQDIMKPQGQQNMNVNQVLNTNRHRIYQPGLQPQRFSTASNQPVSLVQPGHRPQHQQSPRPAGNISKEQQVKQPPPNRNLPQSQNQGQPKGIKWSSNDDVVEVANPNSMKQESQAHPIQAQTTEQSKSNTNQSGPDTQSQLSTQPTQSKAQLEAEQRKIRFHQMVTEVAHSMPVRQPISMSPQTKAKMMQKLREARAMVLRLDNALPVFFRLVRGQKNTEELIRIVRIVHSLFWVFSDGGTKRLLLVSQYGGTDFVPLEQITVTSEELDDYLEKLNKYYQAMAKVVQQQKSSNVAQGQTMNQQPPGFPPMGSKAQLPPETAPSLSTANLKVHQKAMQVQRQKSVQKSNPAHGGNRAPAAPTSPQPPFHFGSPDGVPAKYANRTDELTQERLRIPPKKKRKGDQPPSTVSIPAQPQPFNASKSPQLAKTAPALTEKTPSEALFKCYAPDCVDRLNGFVSQADLDKHILDIHDPKEPTIDDPLRWTLEQMRSGLGLEENGKSKPLHAESKTEQHISEAAKMKKSPSAQDQAAIKQESATPMTRVPTQTGPSPGSNLLKTPQASTNMKTPGSETKSAAKDVKAVESKTSHTLANKQASASPDPWATSLVSSAAVSGAFSGLAGLSSTGTWSTIQHVMTPCSTLSSGMSEKTSPRVSDISENDAVKISLNSDPFDYFDWLTFESANSDDYPNDSDYDIIEGMDWDSTGFDGPLKETENEGAWEGKVEDMGPSREWLKTFAPETLHRMQP